MRIRVNDDDSVVSLLRFLRGHDCIAYVVDGELAVEALCPHLPAGGEDEHLYALVERWRESTVGVS